MSNSAYLTLSALDRLFAAWSYALRHGDYPKITGQLRRSAARLVTVPTPLHDDFTTEVQPAGWCAMGVLCDLIVHPHGPISPIPGEGSLFGRDCAPFLPAPMRMEEMGGSNVDWYRFALDTASADVEIIDPDNEFCEPVYARAWQMECQSLPPALRDLLYLTAEECDEIGKRNDGFEGTSHIIGVCDGEPSVPMQSFPEIADWLDREVIPCLIERARRVAYLHGHE